MTRVALDDIVVRRRHRTDLGDIDALATSIATVGLLHPPVVVDDRGRYRLVAGERRLAAARHLGWDTIDVRVAVSIADAKGLLIAERDENTCRKDFTPSEAVALARTIENIERPRAKANSAANLRRRRSEPTAQVGHSEPDGAASAAEPVGRVADLAAAATGYGRESIRKAAAVVDATTDDDPAVAAAAQAAVDQMDTTGRVDPAYRAVAEARDDAQAARLRAEADAAEPIVIDGENWTPSRRRGLEVAHRAAPAPARIGMGMWDDDGPPVITSAAADWLIGHGYIGTMTDPKWVRLTPAGADIWERVQAHLDPGPPDAPATLPAPEPARPARTATDRVAEAERLLDSGLGVVEIAEQLGEPRTTIEADLRPRIARRAAHEGLSRITDRLDDVVATAGRFDASAASPDPEQLERWLNHIDRAVTILRRLRSRLEPTP